MILYILIGVAVLALIIVIQTGVICYILKAKKTRRIENMALINKPRGSDTVRYSTTPSRKLSLKAPSTEEIYETLDIVQGTDAPPPPPIDTLPKERIKRRSPMPLPDENDGAQNQPVNKNETEPLTRTESNFSVHMRSGKVKIPAFCAPSSAATVAPEKVAKSIRKPSTINQDAISNELNNILKRRADTMAGPNQKTPVATPKQIPETKPKKGIFQALKPPPLHKPTIPVTPAKPHSVLPRPRPTQKPNSPSDKTPNCVKPPTQPLPPLPTQSPRPTPAMSEHVDSPQRPVFKPAPIPLEDDPEYMEGPEYADYNENYDDDSADEWTYEPLDPPSKYDYNIYST
nr:uncharacterized protein LOC128681774 isoform X2 [Plodia interpunctella]